MVGKKNLIGNVNDVVSYTIFHNSINILHKETSDISVVNGVSSISEKAKSHAYKYLETMGECINPALHAWVIIEYVTVEVTEIRYILL